jgi:hypothetical protein
LSLAKLSLFVINSAMAGMRQFINDVYVFINDVYVMSRRTIAVLLTVDRGAPDRIAVAGACRAEDDEVANLRSATRQGDLA